MLLFYGDQLTLAVLISMGLALLVMMTFHEFMHNYIAWLMGDPTGEQQGRLTLNPLVHIYWPGWLMWLIVGFGILGLAPVNQALMINPRVRWADRLSRDQRGALAAAAGLVGNLILGIFFALIYRIILGTAPQLLAPTQSDILPSLGQILNDLVLFNLLSVMINLIPLAPIDGHIILRAFLPPHMRYQYDNFQRQYGPFIFFGLLALSFARVFSIFSFIYQPIITVMIFFYGRSGSPTVSLLVLFGLAAVIIIGWVLFLTPQAGRTTSYVPPTKRSYGDSYYPRIDSYRQQRSAGGFFDNLVRAIRGLFKNDKDKRGGNGKMW